MDKDFINVAMAIDPEWKMVKIPFVEFLDIVSLYTHECLSVDIHDFKAC